MSNLNGSIPIFDEQEPDESESVVVPADEYKTLCRAKELLEIVYDDYVNWGEVLQDETIADVEVFLTGLESEDYTPDGE